jgi:hypothetical protein
LSVRPELRRMTLDDFLHQAVHITRQNPTRLWQVEFMTQVSAARAVEPVRAPLAIESGATRLTAEDYLRQFVVEGEPVRRNGSDRPS